MLALGLCDNDKFYFNYTTKACLDNQYHLNNINVHTYKIDIKYYNLSLKNFDSNNCQNAIIE